MGRAASLSLRVGRVVSCRCAWGVQPPCPMEEDQLYAGLLAVAPPAAAPVEELGFDLVPAPPNLGLLAGNLRDLRPRGRSRSRLGAFLGEQYRTSAHSQYLHACKRARRGERHEADQRADHAALQTAWNNERLREGDKVGSDDEGGGCHPNKFDPAAVLQNAWKQIGGVSKVLSVGVDGVRRALQILGCVAGAAHEEQREFIERRTAEMCERAVCPVITKFYDCTPWRLGFGRLQGQLQCTPGTM